MHRVYVEDGDIWTLASTFVHRAPLTPDRRYVVYRTERPPSAQEVCLVIDDGRRLCDFGPKHDHEAAANLPERPSPHREAQIRTVSDVDGH